MRAFTFSPNQKLVGALQKKLGSTGEVFFAILITQEPIEKSKCQTLVRAFSEREYMDLLHALHEKTEGKVGEPDLGMFFVGPKANGLARGSGRVLVKSVSAPGKGFSKMITKGSLRPLGTAPLKAKVSSEQKNVPAKSEEMFDAWKIKEEPEVSFSDAFGMATSAALDDFEAEAHGMPSPKVLDQALKVESHVQNQDNGMTEQQRLQYAQQVAFDSSNGNARSQGVLPHGRRVRRAPGGVDMDSIADRVAKDLF